MGKLHFDITADSSNFTSSVRQAEAVMGNFTSKATQEGNQLDAVFKKVASAAASMGIAFSAQKFISDLINIRGEFQQTEIAMETMLGSADKANTLISQLVDTAAKTPFGMTDITQGAKQLLAYGIASEEVNDTLTRLGNIASGLSIPLNDLVYLYGTTMTQGRVFTQDMRQFMGRGIPLADELAKQFGVSKDKVSELVTAGKVGFPEVKKAIEAMTNEGGKFFNLMEKQSSSLTGQISNLEDAVTVMKNELGKSVQDIASGAISTASKLIENYDKVGKVIAGLIAAYGTYKAALLAINAVQKVALLGQQIKEWYAMGKALGFATANQIAFNTASKANIYIALASAVIGVATAIFTFNKRQSDAVKTTGEATRKINEETQALKELFDAAKDQTKSEKERAEAIDTINARYGDKLSNLLTEKATVEELTSAYQKLTGAITEKYLAEVKESMVSDRKEAYDDAQSALYGNIQKLARDSGLSAERQGAMVAKMQEWIAKYSKRSTASEVYRGLGEIYRKFGGKDISSKTAGELYGNIWDFKETQYDLYIAEKGFNEFAAGYKSVTDGITDDSKKTAEEQRTTLAKIVADIEAATKKVKTLQTKAAKEGLTDAEQRELEDANTAVDEGKKKYKTYTGRDYGKGGNSAGDSEAKLSKQRKDAAKAEAREMQDLENEVAQAEIAAMNDGAEKVRKQRELDDKLELQRIERSKEDYIDAVVERARAIHEAEQEVALAKDGSYKKKDFDEASARKSAENSDGAKAYDNVIAYTEGRQAVDRRKAEAEAMQEYLLEYGDYEEKRLAITQKYEKLIAEAETEGERMSLAKEKEADLYELEREYKQTATAIQDLFGDMSKTSSKDLYEIADAGERALKSLKGGVFEANNEFGISPEAFAQISESPEKLNEIAEAIKNIREQADALQSPTEKIAAGFKKMFSAAGDTKAFQDGLEMLQSGVSKYTEAAGFISEALSSMGEALGQEWMTDASAGIDSALNVVDSTMQGLQVGSAFGSALGPWGAAIGAVVGLATSLVTEISKAKDAAKQVNIDNWQKEIDELNDSYAELDDKIDKAYSVNKADLIEEQNKNLEAQNANLEKMIAEEDSKKNSDSAQMEAWEKQIEENEKTIEENAVKAQEAINGISFDSFRDKFKDALMDMEGDADDWADDVKDIIRDAMYENLLKDFDEKAEPLLAELAKAQEAGDEAWIKRIEAELNNLYNDFKPQAEEIDKNYGGNESSRSSSAKGIAQASQDSVDELNGRMTMMQSHTFSINERVGNIVGLSSQMLAKLTSIDANTARLVAIEDALKYMRDDLSTIRTKGIIMKA